MTVVKHFGDFADILAQIAPEKVIKLEASKEMGNRVKGLIEKKHNGEITEEEAIELERYLSLDLLINLSKAQARKILAK